MREPKRLFTRVYIRKHKGKIEMLDEEGNKIEKIAKVKEADIEKVSAELIDRFGTIPEDIKIYMREKCIEYMLKELNIQTIVQQQNKVTIILPEEISEKIDGEKLFMDIYSINPKFTLSYRDKKISISLITNNLSKNYVYYIYDLLNSINKQLLRV